MREMKAITLHQPWATLIALNEKGIETRSWKTIHRGKLAIHAAQKIDYEACEIPEIKKALKKHGITPDELPTGSIVAISRLFDCVQMINGTDVPGYRISKKELAFGHYATGRYAWILACTKKLDNPVPARGRQRIWNWEEHR